LTSFFSAVSSEEASEETSEEASEETSEEATEEGSSEEEGVVEEVVLLPVQAARESSMVMASRNAMSFFIVFCSLLGMRENSRLIFL
jgi:hypothetical protein